MELGGTYLQQVKNDNSQAVVNTVTYTDGGVYGFPYTGNAWYMYYDKSVYSEEDVKSLETMLEKGRVSFPLLNSWYLWSFYAAGGGTLFGPKGNNASYGIRLGPNGADVTRYLVDLVQHPNFVVDNEWTSIDDLEKRSVAAVFTGSWDSARIESILGDDMGVAQLPTITLNGKTRQLRSFVSSKCVGVNKQSKNTKVAMQVAAFLSDTDSQMIHYEMREIIPMSKYALDYWQIYADPVALAEMNTLQYTSCVQPTIPEMSYYWDPMNSWGEAIWDGTITENNADQATAQLELDLNAYN
jgi:arabinogalactan oligomer/maltooligosaccharide transport system substrate-binding protein